MKHVFTDISTIAHLWANQLQESGRNSGNFYFEGESIFSYGSHFKIAKHHTNEQGRSVVLFTTRKYSNTTATQIGVTLQACRHKDLIFCKNPNGHSHSENFENWQSNMEESAKKLLNARKPEKYLNEISDQFKQAELYAAYFGLTLPDSLILANSITNKEDYIGYAEKKDALQKEQERKRQEKLKKEHAISLKKWRLFETKRISVNTGADYLRYNSEKKTIETSQSVEIPEQIAKEFYSFIVAANSKGGCTDCNKKILDFSVKSVDKDFVRVGCHNIPMKEIKRIASLLGWSTKESPV